MNITVRAYCEEDLPEMIRIWNEVVEEGGYGINVSTSGSLTSFFASSYAESNLKRILHMYNQYLQYVKEYFLQHGGYYHPDPMYNFRSKYFHTLRVLRWCKTILEDIPTVNQEVLYTAIIFHDVGYAEGKENHAAKSADIFAEYAQQHQLDPDFAKQVIFLIKMHSNKELLKVPDTLPELVLLMEADLLDEEGALRVIWYCATKALQGAEGYADFHDFIQMGSNKRLENPMITPLAKTLWEKKCNLVNDFSAELLNDVNADVSFLQL